jgi:hypothetical protein
LLPIHFRECHKSLRLSNTPWERFWGAVTVYFCI